MTKAEAFHYQDFTRRNYRRMLRLARAKYPLTDYANAALDARFLLWRHDVDISLYAAEKLAVIEQEEGVAATYFLLFQSRSYNLQERESRDQVERILALGHSIGLHFEIESHNIASECDLEAALAAERRRLEDLFGVAVAAFSFHDPSPQALSWRKWRYAGMINCYAEPFQTNIGYCSDSNGYWRHRRLEDVLSAASDERLQVLTHAEWWQDEAMSPRRRLHCCIDAIAQRLKDRYDAGVKLAGRLNVDDDDFERRESA